MDLNNKTVRNALLYIVFKNRIQCMYLNWKWQRCMILRSRVYLYVWYLERKRKWSKGHLLLWRFMLNWMLKRKLIVKATGNSYLWAQRLKIKCLMEHVLRTLFGIWDEHMNRPKPWKFQIIFFSCIESITGLICILLLFKFIYEYVCCCSFLGIFFFFLTKWLISRQISISETFWCEMGYLKCYQFVHDKSKMFIFFCKNCDKI